MDREQQEAVRQMIAWVIQGVMRAAGDVAAAGDSRVYERLADRGVFDGEEAVRAMIAAVFQRVAHSDSVAVDVDTGAVHFFVANGPQKSAMEGLVHSMLSGILERIVAASEVQVMGSRILGEMEGDRRDLAEILRAVEAGGEVHSMVSKVFEEVVAGNEDANHDHDHLEHEVLTSSFDKLALEGCDEELAAATAPLVHYMVSNIVRKVIEARDERGHAGEEERYRKESSDVQAIVRLCREKSVRLAKEVPPFFDAMAYFQLRAGSLLNPEMSSPGVAEDSSKDFLDGCVQRLLREDCPAQETIRLQRSDFCTSRHGSGVEGIENGC
ncbi:uncharacterized protein LOC112348601 [Selaginella moellendorffii]|uniref:uncharacterized protein LOC112348601 n=1 Tax=Selaginella moellendorffii TaxID=88036 RepID=UPI000D1D11F7|nr:uncharacterized protein LOC112348601 [Selaginella moellendorffii]|eukprot:XP_024537204.1 uncharacterized protein LOC112348601 [Selaginella moellendorffii]